MAKTTIFLGKPARSCGDCTKCCEGWLSANINGEDMYPGKPCKSVEPGVGCTIYKTRPEDPCRTFQCNWLSTDYIPEKFKPSATGQIVVSQQLYGIDFLVMAYAGEEIDPEFLSWFVTFAVGRQLNVEWSVDGVLYALGSPAFMEARQRREAEHGGARL